MQKRVMVGMSGGVDSAVAALLLQQEGYQVLGVFMKNWEETDDDGLCTATQDYDDMRRTCDVIGIPYYTVSFTKEYQERVFRVFLREYESGRTPNPDVLCNTEIKFQAFLDFAVQANCDYLATGHYARIGGGKEKTLLRGLDGGKDQSYFLCGLTQDALQKVLFPIGHLPKTRVREIAQERGLPVAQKKDSTGICFIGERRFRTFISRFLQGKTGPMIDRDTGKQVGIHQGLFLYTLGQRKGLSIGGQGTGEPWFVARKDTERNILYVCQGHANPSLYANGLLTQDFHWIGEVPSGRFSCTAKFRYRQKDVPVTVEREGQGVVVSFASPQRAVTPGQYAVLYHREVCLGGGIIQKAL